MSKFTTFFQYFGAILSAVMAVEGQFGSTLPGESKLQLVLGSIQAAATALGSSIPNDQVQMITAVISAVVGTLNATGVFQHAPKP